MSTRPACSTRSRAPSATAFAPIVVDEADVTLDDAVDSYLFNSQLLPRTDGALAAASRRPSAASIRASAAMLDRLVASRRADRRSADVRPAPEHAQRRRSGVPAPARAADRRRSARAIGARVFLDDALADELDAWIRAHYRDRLAPADLADPQLLDESRRALDELTTLLRLPAIYPFQRES